MLYKKYKSPTEKHLYLAPMMKRTDRHFRYLARLISPNLHLFTEMIPKTLGALYWKKMAPSAVYIIKLLIYLTYPFVIAFEFIAKFLSRGKEQEKITTDNEAVSNSLQANFHVGRRLHQTVLQRAWPSEEL